MDSRRPGGGLFALAAVLAAAISPLTGCGDSDEGATAAPREPVRVAADSIAAGVWGLQLKPVAEFAVAGPAPRIADALAPSLAERSCLVISPAPGGEPREVTVPRGGALLEAAIDAPATARLRHVATQSFPIATGRVAPGHTAVVRIPVDRSSRPWQLAIESRAMMSVCGAARG